MQFYRDDVFWKRRLNQKGECAVNRQRFTATHLPIFTITRLVFIYLGHEYIRSVVCDKRASKIKYGFIFCRAYIYIYVVTLRRTRVLVDDDGEHSGFERSRTLCRKWQRRDQAEIKNNISHRLRVRACAWCINQRTATGYTYIFSNLPSMHLSIPDWPSIWRRDYCTPRSPRDDPNAVDERPDKIASAWLTYFMDNKFHRLRRIN